MAKEEKQKNEKCSKCGSHEFVVAKSHLAQRICSKCGATWLPKSIDAINLEIANMTISSLREEIKAKDAELAKYEALKAKLAEKKAKAEAESIFD